MKSSKPSTAGRTALVVAVLLVLAGCSSDREQSSPSTSSSGVDAARAATDDATTTAPSTAAPRPAKNDEHPRIGASCTNKGAIGYAGGGPAICAGTWRYALADDLPPTPAGGYQARPDWYPTLGQIFNRPEPSCPPTDVQLTASVVPLDALTTSVPYGLMVGDHVTPIDHGYLGLTTLGRDPATMTDADYVPVTVPADGTIIEASSLGSPTSHRIVIDHGCGVFSVLMVVNRLTGVLAPIADQVEQQRQVRLEVPVHAGDQLGLQRDNPIDFNVFSSSTWLRGIAEPLSYLYGEAWKPYTTDPLPFFEPSLRTKYASIMQRTVEPRWGVIDYDVIGAASGNWFLDGTVGYSGTSLDQVRAATTEIPGGAVDGKNGYSFGHFALAPHWVQPDQWIASFGWWTDPRGDFKQFLIDLQPGQPAPTEVTAASGIVVYRLTDWQTLNADGTPFSHQNRAPEPIGYRVAKGRTTGIVAVQVNADGTLLVEAVPGALDASAFHGFTAAQRVYHR